MVNGHGSDGEGVPMALPLGEGPNGTYAASGFGHTVLCCVVQRTAETFFGGMVASGRVLGDTRGSFPRGQPSAGKVHAESRLSAF